MPFELGDPYIECGALKLFWGGDGGVSFWKPGQEERDYGIELAPTEWTDISQVNNSNSRIKWYRFDKSRRSKVIPIDQLWESNVE